LRTGVHPSRNLEETLVLSVFPNVDVRIQRKVIPSRGSGEGNIVGLVHDALRLPASRVSVVRGDLFVIWIDPSLIAPHIAHLRVQAAWRERLALR